jgi:hypothetical protein
MRLPLTTLCLAALASAGCQHALDAGTVNQGGRERVFPGNPPPAATLDVLDVRGRDEARLLAALSIQGIVNRDKPRVYLIHAEADRFWLTNMMRYGDIRAERPTPNVKVLLDRYRDEVSGAIVYDPDLPVTINIATMLAGLEDGVICAPGLAAQWGLPVIADLRGRWQTNPEAYRYAIEELYPRMRPDALCCLHPRAAGMMMRDYLISQRIFTFWLTGQGDAEAPGARPEEEKALFEEFMANTPVNIPVIGFWYAWVNGAECGITEYGGVKWAGRYGKFTVACDFAPNVSVHSGVRVPKETFRQRNPRPVASVDGKTGLALTIMESGDSPMYWIHRQRQVWLDPKRGSVPISWCLGPTTVDLIPGILRWYYDEAAAADYFFCAISGLGYMYPFEGYASKTEDPEATWEEYLDKTGAYLKLLDLDWVGLYTHPWQTYDFEQDDPVVARYAEALPFVEGFLLGMGRDENITPDDASRTVAGKPVFHCLTRWPVGPHDPDLTPREYHIRWLVEAIERFTPETRPAALFAMAYSWTYDPGMLVEVVDRLGPGYRAILAPDLPQFAERIPPSAAEREE